MHTQVGFELGTTKHYATAEAAQHFVELRLKGLIDQGVMFNILIVTQRRGGTGTDAEDVRYIPILNCWRVPNSYLPGAVGAMVEAARLGYTCFM